MTLRHDQHRSPWPRKLPEEAAASVGKAVELEAIDFEGKYRVLELKCRSHGLSAVGEVGEAEVQKEAYMAAESTAPSVRNLSYPIVDIRIRRSCSALRGRAVQPIESEQAQNGQPLESP